MSAGSLTVHGSTLSPSAAASATSAGVTLRQNGDHVPQPAALTRRGSDPPWLPRDRVPRARATVDAAFRCTVSIESGLAREAGGFDLRCALLHGDERTPVERLDRDARLELRASRTASATRRANVSGSTVSSGWSGVILVSMLSRSGLPLRAHEVEDLGQRRKALAVDRLLLREDASRSGCPDRDGRCRSA